MECGDSGNTQPVSFRVVDFDHDVQSLVVDGPLSVRVNVDERSSNRVHITGLGEIIDAVDVQSTVLGKEGHVLSFGWRCFFAVCTALHRRGLPTA